MEKTVRLPPNSGLHTMATASLRESLGHESASSFASPSMEILQYLLTVAPVVDAVAIWCIVESKN